MSRLRVEIEIDVVDDDELAELLKKLVNDLICDIDLASLGRDVFMMDLLLENEIKGGEMVIRQYERPDD